VWLACITADLLLRRDLAQAVAPDALALVQRACVAVHACVAHQSLLKIIYGRSTVRALLRGTAACGGGVQASAETHRIRARTARMTALHPHIYDCPSSGVGLQILIVQELVHMALLPLYSAALSAITLTLYAQNKLHIAPSTSPFTTLYDLAMRSAGGGIGTPVSKVFYLQSIFALRLAVMPVPWLVMIKFDHLTMAKARPLVAANAALVLCAACVSAPALPDWVRSVLAAPLLALLGWLSYELWCGRAPLVPLAVLAVICGKVYLTARVWPNMRQVHA
jgi:hypothetical protein